MKASASLLTFFLIAVGCTDATNAPTGLAPPSSVSAARPGNVPPPPADVAIAVCVDDGGCAVFEGSYMSNSLPADELTAAITAMAAEDGGTCTSPGHASLKIDKPLENQFFGFAAGVTSANAQIKCHQGIATGNGTIEIGNAVLNLEHVLLFNNQPDCGFSCGNFVVRNEEGDEVGAGFIVEREAFEDAYCYISFPEEGGPPVPQCYPQSEG